jgi:hypothetical protein
MPIARPGGQSLRAPLRSLAGGPGLAELTVWRTRSLTGEAPVSAPSSWRNRTSRECRRAARSCYPSGPEDPHSTRDYRSIKTLAPRFSRPVPSPVTLSLELIYRRPESPPPRLVVVSPSPCIAITAARIVVFRLGSFGWTCGWCFRAHCAGLTDGDEWICRRSRSTTVSTHAVVAR